MQISHCQQPKLADTRKRSDQSLLGDARSLMMAVSGVVVKGKHLLYILKGDTQVQILSTPQVDEVIRNYPLLDRVRVMYP